MTGAPVNVQTVAGPALKKAPSASRPNGADSTRM